MRQTACLVVSPVTVNNFAAAFSDRASDGSGLETFNKDGWGSIVGTNGVQLLDFCCLRVSVRVLLLGSHLVSSQCWSLIYMFAILMLR